MKDYYKINEISKLYGIGVDSLRYYEKIGVLKPRRDTNGYRLYSLKDIYKLNIIRDLRQLDFSMKQIKEYLDHQSVEQTMALLREEQELIQQQLKQLKARNRIIRERMASLAAASQIPAGVFSVKSFPNRFCLQLNEYITRDEEMDFAVKKLHSRHEKKIRDFGNQSIGASVSLQDLHQGTFHVFHSVFFILEQQIEEYDFVLPAGQYLSYYYRGGYLQSPQRMQEVFDQVQQLGRKILSDPFEIYEIDNRDTGCPEEFLTEIQVRISEGSES
ncbi:MerR family transcriptional regulator [Clostridium minihomine]|uniref:MerR family transcriptional regulator n=1 Tax=Clostridium minihomine TaxID=2045012 RepID=UPI000C76EE19|nr:MerR family transcriptional regulator [Clostridium minihomine]